MPSAPLTSKLARLPSRRVIRIFLNVPFGQIAAPDARRGFADAEIDADGNLRLAEILPKRFEIAVDWGAFFKNRGGAEADGDLGRLDARIEGFADGHDDV